MARLAGTISKVPTMENERGLFTNPILQMCLSTVWPRWLNTRPCRVIISRSHYPMSLICQISEKGCTLLPLWRARHSMRRGSPGNWDGTTHTETLGACNLKRCEQRGWWLIRVYIIRAEPFMKPHATLPKLPACRTPTTKGRYFATCSTLGRRRPTWLG